MTQQEKTSTRKIEYGHYITQEYSILKNIFSYLTAKELKICSRVCKEWEKMAEKFIQHKVECYYSQGKTGWPPFNKLINPALIFYLDNIKYSDQAMTIHNIVSKIYDTKDIPFYRLVAAHPIFSPCSNGVFPTNEQPRSNTVVGRTLIMIPQIPGMTIRKYEFDKKLPIKPEQVAPLLSAKGVVLLSESTSPCVTASNKIIHYLYFTGSKKMEVRPERPCLAGGLLTHTFSFIDDGLQESCPVVAITLEGDNVSIHCDINKTFNFDAFFKRLSENAGPIPENAERFAFVFNCLGRYDTMGNEEFDVFAQYFPGVPYFGFWSYGEFCIPDSHARNMMDPKKIRIDRHIRYLNSACASYMIVTVKH